ncbi:MAG TPA: EcsC family protein [Planctomycetota bacterium]|nr:EcsC family protein [Planctomycetota bacterium]
MSHREEHAYVAAHSPEEIKAEIERLLLTKDEDGTAVERATKLAEMALVARLAPWRAGSVVPNVRRAVQQLAKGADQDATTSRIALRLAACYARAGRTDDEALRLGRYARVRSAGGGLGPDDRAFAAEAANHLDRAIFVPSLECARDLVEELDQESLLREARGQLSRRNASFAVLLLELALFRTHGKSVGPLTPSKVEQGLAAFRKTLARGGGRAQAEVALLLARAYVEGAFVDVRARDHARAVLEHVGDKLDSDAKKRLEDYLEEDAFAVPDDQVYAALKKHAATRALDLRLDVAERMEKGNFGVARRLCELELARRFDPWYMGDPTTNVSRAVSRAAGAFEKLDEEARWVACSLSALYAATLEGASHARALVRAVLTHAADAPELKAALEHAGLDPGVPPAELRAVYEEATDPAAHARSFEQLAARAGLSDEERKAGLEVLAWLAEQRKAEDVSSGVAFVKKRIGDLVEVALPEAVTSAATFMIEATLRNVAAESARSLFRTRLLREVPKNPKEAPLPDLDRSAWSVTHENRLLAALEGFGCGLGGATLVLLDLPALVTVNLNAIAAITTTYGFDPESPEEIERSLLLLAGGPQAFSRDLEAPTVGRLTVRRIPQGAIGGRAALALRTIAVRLSSRLAKQKLLQLIPVVGGAVGAGLNFHYTLETTRAASMLYRFRWLQRKARGV